MHTIEELEKWVGRNKNRECLIDIDDGYGATPWQVILYGNNKEEINFADSFCLNSTSVSTHTSVV